MLQDSNMYFNYIFLENLNLWVLLFYGRLLPQTEMKRLCKITLDSSGWGCGIWITKIFSTVNCGVPKLQWLNLPMFWFPNWNIWYTVFRYTKLSFVYQRIVMVQTNQREKEVRRRNYGKSRTTAHFVIWYSVGGLTITTPQLVRMTNSTKICSWLVQKIVHEDTWCDVKLYISCK